MSITAELPDGRQLEFPDGTDPAVIQSTVKKVLGVASPAPSKQDASFTDRLVGSAPARYMLGMASPVIAGVQLGANAIDAATGTPGPGQWVNEKVKALEEAKQRGMQYEADQNANIPGASLTRNVGTGSGFDAMGLLGSLNPSTAIANKVTSYVPNLAGKYGKGAVTGAAAAASQPVQGNDYWTGKGAQLGVGATFGAGVPMALDASKAIYTGGKSIIEPLYEKGRQAILKRYQERLIGPDATAKEKVVEALRQSREMVPGSQPTAAEALAHTPEGAALAGHQRHISRMSEEGIAPKFKAREMAQEAARENAIVNISKDYPGLGPSHMERAIIERKAVTDPMRDKALAQANMRWTPKQGQPPASDTLKSAVELHGGPSRQPLQTSLDVAEKQVGSLSREVTPLTAKSINQRIQGMGSQPGLRVSEVVTKSLKDLQERIASAANKSGIVDSRDLYMIRKEAGNIIKKYADESKNFDQRLTAGLVKDVQGYIDDAIEMAGGKGWKDYLKTYQELSAPINQMEVGQKLQQALRSASDVKETRGAFQKAVSDAPRTVENAIGLPGRELSDVLTPEQVSTVNAVSSDLARKEAAEALAARTNFSGAKAIHEGRQFPGLLSRPASIVNYMMSKVSEGADSKIAKQAGDLYLNPQGLASFLDGGYGPQMDPWKQRIVEAIMQRAGIPTSIGTGRQF